MLKKKAQQQSHITDRVEKEYKVPNKHCDSDT